jgi:succinate dehydrogenase / fumarate reductase cytochrome b subunit
MTQNFFISSIGKKILMAITGIILFGFVIGHLLGNLQMFQDPERINRYAHFLQSLGPLLWGIRGFLLLVVVVHLIVAIILTKENFAARPSRYIVRQSAKSGLIDNYMGVFGSLLGIYLVFHLLHFTIRAFIYPEFSDLLTSTGERDVYQMVLLSFQVPWVSAFYIFMMAILGLHLWHGIPSFFQTLGIRHKYITPVVTYGGKLVAVIIALGYMSIPIAVLLGIIK